MTGIIIVCNSRAERGPLASVIAALPEATVLGLSELQQQGDPAQVMGFGLWWFTERLRELQPRLVVVLGDRYETLSAALAATFLRIPLAHIHGGETTTGAWDDALRHSISHLTEQTGGVHLPPTQMAADRIMELCYARRLEVVGAPGLDGIPPQSAKRDEPMILVTYHPETMAADGGLAGCEAMLDALTAYAATHRIVFCGVNNDPGGQPVRDAIQSFVQEHSGQIRPTYTHDEYVGMMQHAVLVIGNSSAGVIEAPWVGCPSVNIGRRQDGRPMASSVLNAPPYFIPKSIHEAIAGDFPWGPHYRAGAAPKIAEICRAFVKERGATP